jgi:hypothetical protein
MTTCWECETPTSRPVAVSLAAPAADLGPLLLCPSCYWMSYLPLIAEAPADGTRQAPPPSTPGAPGARRTCRSPLGADEGASSPCGGIF